MGGERTKPNKGGMERKKESNTECDRKRHETSVGSEQNEKK